MKKKAETTSYKFSNNRFLLAGMAASSAIILARPIMPAFVYAADVNKYTWTKQELTVYHGGESYVDVDTSASGSHLIATNYDENAWSRYGGYSHDGWPIYVSRDYGTTWTNVASTADEGIFNVWYSADVSSDGQTMIAASRGGADLSEGGEPQSLPGKIIVSHDAGVSWSDITTNITIPRSSDKPQVAVSGDGGTFAVAIGDDVHISKNDGDSWTSTDINGEGGEMVFTSISISDNGEKLLFGGERISDGDTKVALSLNGGETWSNVTNIPDFDENFAYPTVALSGDGSTFVVGGTVIDDGFTNQLYISKNDGETWVNQSPTDGGETILTSVDMSHNGETITALDVGDIFTEGGEDVRMYVSDDAGANWTQENMDETNSGSIWDFYTTSNLDLNSDGSRVIVGRIGGVYTGVAKSPTVSLSDAQNGKPITITTPYGTTITCNSAITEAGQPQQDGTYDYPLGLVDFCFDTESENNQVSLTFVTDLKPNEVKARKYNPIDKTYSDIPDATITQTTYQGQPALQLTYAITDNGPLDLDTAVGSIKDPVGLALVAGQLADTGQAQTALLLLASSLTAVTTTTILLVSPIRKVASKAASK